MAWIRIAKGVLVALTAATCAVAQNVSTTVGADVEAVLSKGPTCSATCFTTAVTNGNCSLSSLRTLGDCLCPNIVLESALSACTRTSCNITDIALAGVIRSSLCAGHPIESRVWHVRIVSIVVIVVSIPVVVARCIARLQTSKRLWSDDWLAIGALVFLLGGAIMQLSMADDGFGLHVWDVRIENTPPLLKMVFASLLLYVWIKTLAKLSILMLYRRVFPTPWFRRCVDVFLLYLALSTTAWSCAIVFECTPIAAAWDQTVQGKCIDVNALGYIGAIVSVIEDVVLIVMPIPVLRKLQISNQKRIGVAIMFALASFAAVIGIIRTKHIAQFEQTLDSTYDNVETITWSFIELTTALVCGSLPPLRPWFGKLLPAGLSSRNKTSGPTSNFGFATTKKGSSVYSPSMNRMNLKKKDSNTSGEYGDAWPLSSLDSATPGTMTRGRWELRSAPSESETNLVTQNELSVQVTRDVQVSNEPRGSSLDGNPEQHSYSARATSDVRRSNSVK